MQKFRVTILVTLDVEADESGLAVMEAIERVKDAIGDDGVSATGSPARPMWVNGVGRDSRGYMVFGRPMTASETLTVAESSGLSEKMENL